jgi:tetratricopeptide (TPR) repeat protein
MPTAPYISAIVRVLGIVRPLSSHATQRPALTVSKAPVLRVYWFSVLLAFTTVPKTWAQDAASSNTPGVISPVASSNKSAADKSPNPSAASPPPSPAAPAAVLPAAQALQLFRAEKYAAASEQYNAILLKDPKDPAANAGLARVYLAQRKMPEALAAATKAIESAPGSPAGHTALGDIYFRQAKLADAEREYLTPIRAGIPDARAYFGLAHISEMTSSSKRAKRMIDKAHDLDPADPEIFQTWVQTLPLSDRSKQLNDRLASSDPMGDSTQKSFKFATEFYTAEAKQPNTACHLVNKPKSTQLPLERLMIDPTRLRGFGLMVKVNGTSSKLLLDTGAGGILISSKIAQKASARRIIDRSVGGIGDKGLAEGYVAFVDSIKIGDLEFQGCFVDVVDKKRSLGEDGLIGADVFQSFLVDVDFPNEKLGLSELPTPPGETVVESTPESSLSTQRVPHDRYVAPEMKDYEKIYRSGHDLLISTYVNKMVPRLFLIDTGAYDNLLSTDVAREYTKVRSDEFSVVKGLSGKVNNLHSADKVRIAFAHFMQDNEDVTTFDLTGISDDTGTEVSGFLGFSLLWVLDMKIDYRDGLVNFSYDPAHLR